MSQGEREPQMLDVLLSCTPDQRPFADKVTAALADEGVSVLVHSGTGQRTPASPYRLFVVAFTLDYPRDPTNQDMLSRAHLAGLAEGDGSRRVLTLLPVDTDFDLEQLHPIELRHDRLPRVDDVDAVVSAVRHKLEPLTTSMQAVDLPAPIRWHPQWARVRHPGFVGRVETLWHVHSMLQTGHSVVVSSGSFGGSFLHGLGGIGKTLLAAEYAERYTSAYPGGVLWLRATVPQQAARPERAD